MTIGVRLLCGICISAILLGFVAPGVYAPIQPERSQTVETSPDIDSHESSNSGSPQELLPPLSPSTTASSPLFGTLEGVVEQHDELLGPYGEHLKQQLVEADGTFRQIRQENARAIQQAGRRLRIPGRSPHVVLILIPGLKTDLLRCYHPAAEPTPGFERLAQMGTRLLSLESSSQGTGSHWTCLVDHGRSNQHGKSPAMMSLIWNAGYDTYWFGDVSQLPAEPLALGFETWIGFRDSHEAAIPEPTHFWTNGRSIELKVQAETETEHRLSAPEMLMNATVRTLRRHQRSRPVMAVSYIAPQEQTPAKFDTIPSTLIEMLDQSGLLDNTVFMVAGVPTGPETKLAPFFVIWPHRQLGGTVVDAPAKWSDVVATIGELTEVPTSRQAWEGRSQLKLWRPN